MTTLQIIFFIFIGFIWGVIFVDILFDYNNKIKSLNDRIETLELERDLWRKEACKQKGLAKD